MSSGGPSGPSGTAEPGLRTASLIALAGAAGTAILAVGHMGVEIPVVSALGPGGNRPVWPAAVAFTVAALAYGTVAIGLRRRRRWSMPAAALLFAATLVGSLLPFRGAGSIVGALLSIAGLASLAAEAQRRGPLATTER